MNARALHTKSRTIRICAHGYYLIIFEPLDTTAHSYYKCFTVPETCPEFSAATNLLIAIRVAWLPKHFDPFGIYRLLSPSSNIFLQ